MLVLQPEFKDFAFFVYISDWSKNMNILILQKVVNGSGQNMDPLRIQRMAENFGFTVGIDISDLSKHVKMLIVQ